MAVTRNAGAELYYEVHGPDPGTTSDSGARPSVVFAHGRGGNATSWWQQVPQFARDYRVIVFDHRSFGRSRCAPADFDRSRFPSDLIAILDAEGIERAALVCQSMGGWTGLAAAVQFPHRVSALVLSNTPAGIDLAQVAPEFANTGQPFAQFSSGRATVAPDFAKRRPEAAHLYTQIGSLNINLPASLPLGRADVISAAQLGAITAPTLFISAEHDQLFPHTLIKRLSAAVPGAQFVNLPDAGHSPYFETPDAFNETVLRFLATVPD